MNHSLLQSLFGCTHRKTTFPMTIKAHTYIACLDCGKELPYNWENMKRISQPRFAGIRRAMVGFRLRSAE